MFSKGYIKQLQSLHADKTRPRGFGGKIKDIGEIYNYLDKWQPTTLLDYGCGKGVILSHLKERYPNINCVGYDPAVKMFESLNRSDFDCVFSNDVLEHVEPDFLKDVLGHVNNLALKYIWLRIDTKPARKTLPDGRNAHLILKNQDWWTDKLSKFLDGNIVYNNLNKKGKLDIAIEK